MHSFRVEGILLRLWTTTCRCGQHRKRQALSSLAATLSSGSYCNAAPPRAAPPSELQGRWQGSCAGSNSPVIRYTVSYSPFPNNAQKHSMHWKLSDKSQWCELHLMKRFYSGRFPSHREAALYDLRWCMSACLWVVIKGPKKQQPNKREYLLLRPYSPISTPPAKAGVQHGTATPWKRFRTSTHWALVATTDSASRAASNSVPASVVFSNRTTCSGPWFSPIASMILKVPSLRINDT